MELGVTDTVTWASQAGGKWVTKTGIILAVVEPGNLPEEYRFKSLYRKGIGKPRDHVSYVVAIQIEDRVPQFYWPRTSVLEGSGGE